MSELLEKFTRNEFGSSSFKSNNGGGGQREDTSRNSPAMGRKEALSGKFTNYAKNLNQTANNNLNNNNNNNNNYANGQVTNGSAGAKLSNNNHHHNHHNTGNSHSGDLLNHQPNMHGNNGNSKVQNSYDRYPKQGGGLQLFPMNGLNEQMNNSGESPVEIQRHRAHVERLREQEASRAEQDRLEEILQLCAEYERQNSSLSNITASPIVQNRIKTNGSLPRDKKSPFGSEISSPMFNECKNSQVFFPSENAPVEVLRAPRMGSGSSTGYENVALVASMRRMEVSTRPYENVSDVVGDTHEYPLSPHKKYVPQSPRTKIRTNCQASPKPVQKTVEQERKNEYDLLMKSFEDRQVFEDQQKYSEAEKRIIANVRLNGNSPSKEGAQKADGRSVATLKKSRNEVLRRVRELKTEIADLQRQEDEVLREVSKGFLGQGVVVGVDFITSPPYLVQNVIQIY